MSDYLNPMSSFDAPNVMSYSDYIKDVPHGCTVELYTKASDIGVFHYANGQGSYRPTIRSYRDGVKIGCTFVSNDAFRQIVKWHENQLKDEGTLHQKEY